MSSATLNVSDRFPDGTEVGAYRNQPSGLEGQPAGAPEQTATVAGGSLSFGNLYPEQAYVAAAQVGGVWKRYAFSTFTTPGPVINGIELARAEDAAPFDDKTVDMRQSDGIGNFIRFLDAAGDVLGLLRRLGGDAIGLVAANVLTLEGDEGVGIVSQTGVNITTPLLETEAATYKADWTAAPSSGAHVRGEIAFRADPSAGGKIGWVCVTSGTPGTWKAFGAIDS